MLIRDATLADISSVAAIYAHHVQNGVGTFEETAPDEAEILRRWESVRALGLPWLVAEESGRLWGYAYATPFRTRAAYRYVAEDAVYVAPDAQRKGVGRLVLSSLIERCEALGLRQLMAVIGDSGNSGSVGLHGALGFETIGSFRSVGFKHRRWLDIILMQKALNGGDSLPPDGPGLPLA